MTNNHNKILDPFGNPKNADSDESQSLHGDRVYEGNKPEEIMDLAREKVSDDEGGDDNKRDEEMDEAQGMTIQEEEELESIVQNQEE